MSHFGAWKTGRGARTSRDGRMNRAEESWSNRLEVLRIAGAIAAFAFEPLKLRLADRTWYEIDFLVQAPDGVLEAHEVKGHWEDDARVKWKVAAEQHPWLRFFAIMSDKTGGWHVECYDAADRERAARFYGAVRGVRPEAVGSVAGADRPQGRRVSPPRKNV